MGKAQSMLFLQILQSHHFNAVKMVEGKKKGGGKNSSVLIAVGFGADLMRKITPGS